LVREINRIRETDKDKAAELASMLKSLAEPLGLLQLNPEEYLKTGIQEDRFAEIETLVASREQARQDKDWKQSDTIRDKLTEMGIVIEDTPAGTVWREQK